MGKRKIVVKQSAAKSVASIAWYIESKGMIATAEKFSNDVYDFLNKISDDVRSFSRCLDVNRAVMGYKCISYRKKYTIVFIETETELTICEFISSKLIR